MNWLVVIAVLAVLLAIRWRGASMLLWAAAWWLGALVFFRLGFIVPIPASVIKLYMGIVSLSLLAFVLTDKRRIDEVKGPVHAFMVERRFQPYLIAAVLLIPAVYAFSIYAQMTREPQAPAFPRTIHPAPPDTITVEGTDYQLGFADNPYRELETRDPEAFRAHVAKGREVYYANCFYCHGDLMAGEGMFAHALNPIPTSFQDAGVLPNLREAFLFWRVSKGAPGLPEEGGPWASAMPAWESFLSQEEMWSAVLFLYDFTGFRPRAVETH